MDWAKGYLLITLAAFLCEYIRLRVDYHILEIAIMVAAAPLAIFVICVLFYFVLAALTVGWISPPTFVQTSATSSRTAAAEAAACAQTPDDAHLKLTSWCVS